MNYILMQDLDKNYTFTFEGDDRLLTVFSEYTILGVITEDKHNEILTSLNTVEWDKKIKINQDFTITKVERYTKEEKDKILAKRKLEEQESYKRKIIETNNRIKELNEIGLGGGADEAKLKLELEKYRKLYMDSIHEEALKENQTRV